MLRGHTRLGHKYTIALCRGHHQGQWTEAQRITLAPALRVAISSGRKAFTAVYPTELDLWKATQLELGEQADEPPTKVLPRRLV